VRRSDEASLTAARYRADLTRLSAAASWWVPGHAGAGSDSRKDSNNGVTARMRPNPMQERLPRRGTGGPPAPILGAICHQPFGDPPSPTRRIDPPTWHRPGCRVTVDP
jgi:hypothetical protein